MNQSKPSLQEPSGLDKELDRIIADLDREIVRFYEKNRLAFLNWASGKYSLEQEELMDIYQDATLILFNKLREGRLADLEYSLKTYLFGIAKNLIRERYRKLDRDRKHYERIALKFANPPAETDEELAEIVRGSIDRLSGICRQIVTLFYLHGLKAEDIRQRMAYKNPEVVRTQKMRCLKKLRALIMRQMSKS